MHELQPHQQRVVEERRELQKKCEKLNDFIPGPICKQLPMDEQVRLRMQLNYMRLYGEVLAERIADFYRIGYGA